MSSLNITNDADCVVISDEDDDDLAIPKNASGKSTSANDKPTSFLGIHSIIVSLNESDGRRMSRRRKNKSDIGDVTKDKDETLANVALESNATTTTTTTLTTTATTITANTATTATNAPTTDGGTNNIDKKFNISDNRAETRSRKRERSSSPPVAEIKENEPVPFKDVLTGLEGAAFQSRYDIEEYAILIASSISVFFPLLT